MTRGADRGGATRLRAAGLALLAAGLAGALAGCGGGGGGGGVTITVTVSPATATLATGETRSFAATVSGSSNTAVTWSATGGSITAGGAYTAPAAAGTFTVRATSAADVSRSGTATVTVNPAVSVTVSPAPAVVAPGMSRAFAAVVSGSANQAVTWTAEGGGSITAAGVYTAPAAAGAFTVRATSAADPARSGTAAVTVPSAPFVVSTFGARAYSPGAPLAVTLRAGPAAGTAAWGAEDQIPAGWSVDPASISDSGVFDAATRKVKWGPFFDPAARSLAYSATPPAGAVGAAAFAGVGAFDAAVGSILGDRIIGN